LNMQKWQSVTIGAGLGLAIIGLAMAFTNPSPQQYEDFVVGQLKNRLQAECSQAGNNLLGALANTTCRTMTAMGEPYVSQALKPLVSDGTKRYDFLLFSIYVTDLSISQLNFSGRVESIGAFNSFLVYRLP
jgi:Domain of unknown function (DUF4359)